MEESEQHLHWTREFFVEKGELFLRVMKSERVLKRGEEAAKVLADYGDFAVVEYPSYDPVTSRATSRWVYYEKVGKDLKYLGELSYSLRVYALHELAEVAKRAGWCFVEAFYSFKERELFKPLGPLNAVFKPCEET